jgi:isocitrate lyase
MKKIVLISLIGISFAGCFKSNVEPYYSEGYRPIYLSRSEIEKVVFTTPQPLKSPGKIYIKDGYLFVNEGGKGVHVFDNKDPQNPIKIAFYQIPGNVDIAIKGAILYADNGRDLLSIDVTNPKEAKVLNRAKDIFPNQEFPLNTGVSFECVDNAKGVVVGWEKVTYKDPNFNSSKFNCYR